MQLPTPAYPIDLINYYLLIVVFILGIIGLAFIIYSESPGRVPPEPTGGEPDPDD
ncbi:MAG: hypothetical protein ACFFEK_13110 [Candidatus Thorarchaeota archaeon]